MQMHAIHDSVHSLTKKGPTLPISQEVHATKYRQKDETFEDAMLRLSRTLSDNSAHEYDLFDIFYDQRFLAAGRVQSAIGASREVTPINCFVSQKIEDNSHSIMDAAYKAFMTMRLGGGIGYDFSGIRPKYDLIEKLQSQASGPISFMNIFDAVCATVSSAGHRRGAQMGVLRVDHPDILEFVKAKRNTDKLVNFNISVAITDEFMHCVEHGLMFNLRFNGKVYSHVDARHLWNEIMHSTWDWAEPGVIFVDRMNDMNNLWYCETISATNPCAEQPLPPNGACLLGSFNMVKYITQVSSQRYLNFEMFRRDIFHVVRAMDNIVDIALYPLDSQKNEEHNKRRMGLGVTGMANAIEALGYAYGSPVYIDFQDLILSTLRDTCYIASTYVAEEKGSFPLFDRDKYVTGKFIRNLPKYIQTMIYEKGIRNSHLTSVAPTGTISLTADNVSSGIEPVFSYGFDRVINMPDGVRTERVDDYGVRVFGVHGKTADKCTVDEHVNVLIHAQKYVDSAVSKTCNVGQNVSFEDFKDIYLKAWRGGAKGCTTFRANGKRMGILNAVSEEKSPEADGTACFIDPTTGQKSCG